MGGISTGSDVVEFVSAGARSVALGTRLFVDPGAPGRVRRELQVEAERLGVGLLDNAFAAAHGGEGRADTLDSHLRVAPGKVLQIG
jgi:dihydroorotate dehydrogenase (NAD+) catalytic subunit